MKRIFFILAIGFVAAAFAAPQTVRDLFNRVRGVSSTDMESVAAPLEQEPVAGEELTDWAPPQLDAGSLDEATEATQTYAPGSVRHNWVQAAEDNPLLADGSVARLPELGETVEVPLAPADGSQPLVESLPPVDERSAPLASAEAGMESTDSILDLLPPVGLESDPAAAGLPEELADPSASPDIFAENDPDGPGDESTTAPLVEAPRVADASPPRAAPAPAMQSPMLADLDPPAESELTGANLLLFAREMVQLQVWEDWHVSETAAGRDVRLVVSSKPFMNTLEQGMWLSCHVVRAPGDARALESLLMERVAAVTKERATLVTTRAIEVGQRPGVRADFLLETQPMVVRGQADRRRFDGFHMLVPTPWALIEIHGVSPVNDKAGLQKLEQSLASLRLQEPKPWSRKAVPSTQDAKAAFGVWKSSRGRMRIFDKGRIDIEADRLLLLSSPTSRQEAERMEAEGPPRLRGTYRAAGDVIYITWVDGSRLNLRWKLSKGKLLVTDHQGQISKLKPLIE